MRVTQPNPFLSTWLHILYNKTTKVCLNPRSKINNDSSVRPSLSLLHLVTKSPELPTDDPFWFVRPPNGTSQGQGSKGRPMDS